MNHYTRGAPQYAKQAIIKEIYLKRFLETLQARSQLGAGEDKPITPTPPLPHLGHASSQISLGVGVRNDDEIFHEVSYRAAYHGLNDPDKGYLKGSQIVFGDIRLRYGAIGGVRLQHFDLINIISLSPRDKFFKPLSFKVQTGWTRKSFPKNSDALVYQVNSGVGLTFPIDSPVSRIGSYYALAEAILNVGNGYRLGIGVQTGLLTDITPYWKSNLYVEALFYKLEEQFQEKRISTVQTFSIDQSHSIRLSLLKEEVYHQNKTEAGIAWNYYF